MSSTRNKRKRPENDTPAIATAQRRRSRAGAASEAAPLDEKSEGDNENAKASREPATNTTPMAPHSPKLEAKPDTDPPGDETKTNTKSQTLDNNKGSSQTSESVEAAKATVVDPGSSSSQEETPIRNQALHLSDSENTATETGSSVLDTTGDGRESRIRGFIAHRSLLLERIRICRSAAEKRLGETIIDKIPGERGSKPTGTEKAMTDDEEIAAFREMTKQASLAAKKSRPEGEGTAEKRTSLSLRRGSGVGKKMNAALSSLAPGSNTFANADFQSTHHIHATNLPPGKLAIPKPAPSQILSGGQTLTGAMHQQQTAPLNKTIQTSPAPKILYNTKQPIPSIQEMKNRVPNQKNQKSATNTTARPSVTRAEPTSAPLHFGANASVPPINRLAQTKVNCPEAVHLREKRDGIQLKLKALLERQNKRGINGTESAETLHRTSLPASKKNKKEISRLMALGSQPPPQLPRRRKTHWDSLLQEMRWMATDFIEERKWKMSSARTIASAIPAPGLVSVILPVSRNVETKLDSDAKLGISSDFKESTIDTPEETGEAAAPSSKKSTKKARLVEQRQYVLPSIEDLKSARKVGQIVSVMISELGAATTDAGSIGIEDGFPSEALERYLKNRSTILNERSSDTLASQQHPEESGEASDKTEEEPQVKVGIETAGEDSNTEKMDEITEDPTFESVSEQINRLCKFNGRSRNKLFPKDLVNALEAEKLNLSGEQKDCVDFVEKLWGGTPSVGSVLIGPGTSGKTIATCSLLWKHRSKGPQMVICPPTSVIRWKHELGRFVNTRVLTFGLSGGISCPDNVKDDIVDLEPGDFVVCEYSSIHRLLSFTKKQDFHFHSVVVDCRHSTGFFSSSGASSESKLSFSEKDRDEWNGPKELISTCWWDDIIKLLMNHAECRLLIEYPDPDTCSLSKSGLSERQQLEILASRAAFVVGPKIFYSNQVSLQRRVISWARQKGKKSIADKVARVRNVLSESVEPLGFQILESLATSSDFVWDVRRCPMSPTQRSEYDRCCAEVRGSLSLCLEDANVAGQPFSPSNRAISNSLLQLRQRCFHSNARLAISSLRVRSRVGTLSSRLSIDDGRKSNGRDCSSLFWRKFCDSPAQPDESLAFDLVKDSAKLRELASILEVECGYKLHSGHILKPLLGHNKKFGSKRGSNSDCSGPKKVAILAVLPEVQLLVSVFLNLIGIQHDLLQRESFQSSFLRYAKGASSVQTTNADRHQVSALAWAEYQTIVSRFNSDLQNNGLDVSSPTNIVVASPASLAAWNNGLGIEMADLVICVDDDWTGRGELMLESLIGRWQARRELSGRECCLVRLVCADTLEEKIMETSDQKDGSSIEGPKWPNDPSGFLTLPECDGDESVDLYKRSKDPLTSQFHFFPATNILRLRGELLSDILLSSVPLPPLLVSGAVVRFLPPASEKDALTNENNEGGCSNEVAAEMSFVRDFLRFERSASLRNCTGAGTLELLLTSSADESEMCVLPPPLAFFPKEMMTRQDLPTLATRFHLERQCKSSVWAPTGLGSVVVPLARLPVPSSTGPGSTSNAVPTSVVNTSSDLADAWHRSGLSSKPDDLATSLLFYRSRIEDDSSQNKDRKMTAFQSDKKQPYPQLHAQNSDHALDLAMTKRRFNAYAKLFSSRWDMYSVRDGNQGCEPLVFFPPLFPRMLECSARARRQAETPVSAKPAVEQTAQAEPSALVKRKEVETSAAHTIPNAKRMRVEDQPPVPTGPSASLSGKPELLAPAMNTTEPPASTAPVSVTVPRKSELGDMQNPGQNISAAQPGLSTPVITEDEVSLGGSASASVLFDEDYGLLGAGILPLPSESVISSARTTAGNDAEGRWSSSSGRDILSCSIPCDSEEAEHDVMMAESNSLNSMILFVKKRPKVSSSHVDPQGTMYRPPHGIPIGDNQWARAHGLQVPASLPGLGSSFKEVNGDELGKKKKKHPSQSSLQITPSAFTRVPVPGMSQASRLPQMPPSNVMQFAPGKDGHRHRLLASFASRQFGTRLTMFESIPYRNASMQVTNRVAGRVERLIWKSNLSYEAGAGLPLQFVQEPTQSSLADGGGSAEFGVGWSYIVKRVQKGYVAIDAAKSQSTSQRSALRRSLTSPCRVDFGPFAGGYLSSPSGMTGVSPPRSRLGVSLPMGVKVPQAPREQPQPAWTGEDDQLLQDCAVRFGMNWMLVARALSGFEAFIVTYKIANATGQGVRAQSRSARQCRDRWQTLARSQPSVANEVRKSERMFRESALVSSVNIPGRDDSAVIMGSGTNISNDSHAVFLLSKPSLFAMRAEQKDTDNVIPGITPMDINVVSDHKENPAQNGTSNSQSTPGEAKGGGVPSQIESGGGAQATKPRRSFAALSAAKAKRQFIPITIPGMVAGQPANQPVASHPSHMQSVQASAAAQASSGRTEMWPLQILDFADKHRASRSTTKSAATSSGSSRRQTPSKSSSAQSHRSSSSHTSSAARTASFPPVPPSTARTSSSQRPIKPASSSGMSPPAVPAPSQNTPPQKSPPPSKSDQVKTTPG